MRKFVAAVSFTLLLGADLRIAQATDQTVQTGFLDRTLTIGQHTYRYQIYVPPDYGSRTTWPVILHLHGLDGRCRRLSDCISIT